MPKSRYERNKERRAARLKKLYGTEFEIRPKVRNILVPQYGEGQIELAQGKCYNIYESVWGPSKVGYKTTYNKSHFHAWIVSIRRTYEGVHHVRVELPNGDIAEMNTIGCADGTPGSKWERYFEYVGERMPRGP